MSKDMKQTEDIEVWLYVSESLLPAGDAVIEIAELVSVSQLRNAELGVSGGLIFTGKRFAQLIEGATSSIELLKESIIEDSRHRRVTTIISGPRFERMFDGWSLVYSGGSRYMASLLEEVVLDRVEQSPVTATALVRLFQEFATDLPSGG